MSAASRAISAAFGVTTKNMACTPLSAAFSADGEALRVTSRPPWRVTA